jgi:hypothetical protein
MGEMQLTNNNTINLEAAAPVKYDVETDDPEAQSAA